MPSPSWVEPLGIGSRAVEDSSRAERGTLGTTLTLYRAAVMAVALWSLLATTVVVGVLVEGGFDALVALIRSPASLFTSTALGAWAVGAVGAFLIFLAAFVLSQAVGRGLLRLLAPVPLPWPKRVARPGIPVRLLAFSSERPDAFTFTLLRPGWKLPWRREEIILVADALLDLLGPEEWDAVVAHELGHVRAFDGRYLTFLRTFARLLRWDPILAVLARRLTRREEFRADEEAVALTGRPRALARAIYKAARLPSSSTGALAGLLGPGGRAGQRHALERIRRLIALAEHGPFEEGDGAS